MDVDVAVLKMNARYNLSIEDLIRRVKFEDFASADVNSSNFREQKRPEERRKQAFLLHVGGSIEEVESVMKKRRLRPATVKELLSFAIDCPSAHGDFPVIACGSVWQDCGNRQVAYIHRSEGKRRLDIRPYEDCFGSCRFLAFRK